MAKCWRPHLERRWIHSGRISDREEFCWCRDTNRLINESRRQLVSSCLGQSVNARQRWLAIRKLLHDDNMLASIDDDVLFCNMFANFFESKIDSLKSAITSQLIHIAPPPLDPVCSYPYKYKYVISTVPLTPIVTSGALTTVSSLKRLQKETFSGAL